VCALVLSFGVVAGVSRATAPEPVEPPAVAQSTTSAAAAPRPTVTEEPVKTVEVAVRPPKGLKTITYVHVPDGFPEDAAPGDIGAVTEALHATRKLPLYDRPGGQPRAYLPPDIRGVEVTVPIVDHAPGWVAVLVPSANRRIGWLPENAPENAPENGWEKRQLHDQLIVRRKNHELTWLRDGVRQNSWTVATGSNRTPTPLGRTFVLGRTGTHGAVYAGLDALVLGAVPDDRDAVAAGLRNAHTGIHAWYRRSAFGHSVSNGCIRMPADAQRTLLANIGSGTPVTVVD
jgi:lipoprotein-anchoring transpeptidase ErfK/SrfK